MCPALVAERDHEATTRSARNHTMIKEPVQHRQVKRTPPATSTDPWPPFNHVTLKSP
jgi:hypothetical protein